MPEEGKVVEEVAPKKAASKAKANNQNKVVKVKNISNRIINTSKGAIEPNKEGKCTAAELRQFNKILESA